MFFYVCKKNVVSLHYKIKKGEQIMQSRIIKFIIIVIGFIFIFGLSWVKLWFALLGFILIIGLLCYELFVLLW